MTEREQILNQAKLELSFYLLELINKHDLHLEEAISVLVSETHKMSDLLLREMKR